MLPEPVIYVPVYATEEEGNFWRHPLHPLAFILLFDALIETIRIVMSTGTTPLIM